MNLFILESDSRLSSVDLSQRTSDFTWYNGDRLHSVSNYVYIWMDMRNMASEPLSFFIANSTRNYYSELLVPQDSGALTLYRHGDIVPVSESPIANNKMVFPIILETDSSTSYVLELHGPRGIVVELSALSTHQWLERTSFERWMVGLVVGMILILYSLNLMLGITLKKGYFFRLSLFILSIFFFFLRQTRMLLLLIDPLIYPEWLFPLTVGLNLVTGVLLLLDLINPYLSSIKKRFLWALLGLILILVFVSFFGLPYVMADLLNFISLLILLPVFFSMLKAYKAGDEDIILVSLSFSTWILVMVFDILAAFMNIRVTFLGEYRQIFGLTGSLVLLMICSLYQDRIGRIQKARKMQQQLESSRAEYEVKISSLSELSAAVTNDLKYKINHPLNMIITTTRQLEREVLEPKVTAVSKLIRDSATQIKGFIQEEKKNSGEDAEVSIEGIKVLFSPEENSPRIGLYDSNRDNAEKTSYILNSGGFQVLPFVDQYDLIRLQNENPLDILVIDYATVGMDGFSQSRLLRNQYSFLDLPMLMIVPSYSQHLMEQGYASGINDFLTRPYEASQLINRIRSLVKLKEISSQNRKLEMSDKEKNIFLYFLTHNVNTPLTILINRIKELEELEDWEELADIHEDLESSSREISDIVNNVLIAFRISDGRQTAQLNNIDIRPMLEDLLVSFQKKTDSKNQEISFDLPETLPSVRADYFTLRGILYNIIDNAVKYAPIGGEIELLVHSSEELVIKVVDNGPGISEENRARLFKRFEKLGSRPTGGESSTGIGLYVAHQLTLLMQGTLEYEPSPEGACFVLRLPLANIGASK